VVILLVEDNRADILLIRQALASAVPDVSIHVAMDGEQAIRMLSDGEPDLIILDLNVPKVPGFAILAHCRPTAPVVVFTSSGKPAEMRRAEELGVREFVQKPMNCEEFERVVRRMVERWANPSGRHAVP
jgi:CheY-like chemotaxis protein